MLIGAIEILLLLLLLLLLTLLLLLLPASQWAIRRRPEKEGWGKGTWEGVYPIIKCYQRKK